MDINEIISNINSHVWGWGLILLVLGTGVILSVRTKLVQFRHFGKGFKYMFKNEGGAEGDVSAFGSLCTALSATIGTGNIVGVATAIAAGGPGALFWMVMAALLGMATKYAEGLLAVKYRTYSAEGKVLGGPFYYIETGLHERFGGNWKWLGKLFALFGVLAGLLGIGTITQINGITSAAQNIFENSNTLFTVGSGSAAVDITLAKLICGVVVTVVSAFVIIGGVKRIAKVSEIVVPFMSIVYVLFAVIILLCNAKAIPAAISLIFKSAFNISAVGGAITGLTLKTVIQKGVGRGIFSNEAGLGSAPIASAAAKTRYPVRQGLVSMMGTFIDTVVICTMTGLTIIITGAWNSAGAEQLGGFDITAKSWQGSLTSIGRAPVIILSVSLMFFAFTTIVGWSYYSERCLEYLVGGNKKGATTAFKIAYILAVAIGPYLTVSAVWNMADVFNGLMAFPNLVALILLSGIVARETNDYFKKPHLK